MQAFSQAIQQIEQMRTQVAGRETDRQLFFEDKINPYHALVELCLHKDQPEAALGYAERAKARVLHDVLKRGRLPLSQTMTPEQQAQEKRLSGQIRDLNLQLLQEQEKKEPDPIRIEKLRGELKTSRVKYDALQDAISALQANTRVLPRTTPHLPLDQLAAFIPDQHTAFLEYVVTEEKIYLFVVSKKAGTQTLELRVYPINLAERELAQLVQGFRQAIIQKAPKFVIPARQFYDLLIRPAAEQLRGKTTLCIIPDGALWEVPFQVFQSGEGKYLLEEHALYYGASLHVLTELWKRDRSPLANQPTLLAMGNPSWGNDTLARLTAVTRSGLLIPLPEAEAEGKAPEQFFGPARSKILLGRQARENPFKAEAGTYRYLHLATHGEIDDQDPLSSKLVMARADDDPESDGLLEAREIMQLDLKAELAVLSACQTARGRVGAGEGMIGLTWAFFVAGTPTTVVSQWNVNSASTSQLMINFYCWLNKNESTNGPRMAKAEALRRAALDILQDQRYRDPYYWAGFIIVGDGR